MDLPSRIQTHVAWSVGYSNSIENPAMVFRLFMINSDSGMKLNGEIQLTEQRNKSELVASVESY